MGVSSTACYIVVGSLNVPYTFFSVSMISPTVAFSVKGSNRYGIRFSPRPAAPSSSASALATFA